MQLLSNFALKNNSYYLVKRVSLLAASIIFGEHLKASFSDILFGQDFPLASVGARLAACDTFLAAARKRFTDLTAMALLRILTLAGEDPDVTSLVPPADEADRFDIFQGNNSST